MNIQEAKTLKQGQIIYHSEKKNADGTPMRARITSIKTWKRSPERIELKVKRGLYEYATFNQDEIHVLALNESDCK
jgi:hypothetical protein